MTSRYRLLAAVAPFAVVLVVIAAAAVLEPAFFGLGNLQNVTRQAAFLGVVALGQLLVVIARGLDLSVGAVITTTLLLLVQIAGRPGGSVVLALIAVLVVGAAIGTLNAVMVTVRRVPAILATLATMVLIEGVALWVTEGQSRGRVPDLVKPLGTGKLGPIPIPVIITAGLAVVVALVLRRSTYGRSLYAVGSNPGATHLSGISTRLVGATTFVVCSLMAVIAGLMLSGFVGFYDRTLGVGYELDSIAAVVLGGASLAGGRGTVSGTLAAAVGLAALDNLLLLVGVDQSFQLIGKAAVLFVAVLAAGLLFTPKTISPRRDDEHRGSRPEPKGAPG